MRGVDLPHRIGQLKTGTPDNSPKKLGLKHGPNPPPYPGRKHHRASAPLRENLRVRMGGIRLGKVNGEARSGSRSVSGSIGLIGLIGNHCLEATPEGVGLFGQAQDRSGTNRPPPGTTGGSVQGGG